MKFKELISVMDLSNNLRIFTSDSGRCSGCLKDEEFYDKLRKFYNKTVTMVTYSPGYPCFDENEEDYYLEVYLI